MAGLLERDRELAVLEGRLTDALRGEGRVVVVEGPAGIGKTRLLEELRERARDSGVRVLGARGHEIERDFAFGIVRQLVEPVLLDHGDDLFAGAAAGARSSLEESVAVLERSEARLERAESLAALGAAMRREGARTDAREPLRRALELATVCGARPLIERVRDELGAAGARPRRVELSGPESLTRSERNVASLAASGLTNRDIAQRLFVTEKTIETHLGRAFAKLGIRSRKELPGVLEVAEAA